MWRALVNSWDALELWLTQLGFPFQVLFAVVVLLPVCWGAAALVDRLSDLLSDRLSDRLSGRLSDFVALHVRKPVRLRRRSRV